MTSTRVLINLPADVQTAVSAVITACHGWQPTLVPSPAAPLSPPQPTQGLTEAQVCGFIQPPKEQFWQGFNAVLALCLGGMAAA